MHDLDLASRSLFWEAGMRKEKLCHNKIARGVGTKLWKPDGIFSRVLGYMGLKTVGLVLS